MIVPGWCLWFLTFNPIVEWINLGGGVEDLFPQSTEVNAQIIHSLGDPLDIYVG